MRISDWSSDVCSSDLIAQGVPGAEWFYDWAGGLIWLSLPPSADACAATVRGAVETHGGHATLIRADAATRAAVPVRSEEHTSELQSLKSNSYAVFCLKKKKCM